MEYNEAQRQAIEHNKGPMMVLAGPGSGKTTVIINRTRTLIEKYGVDPRRILVITFTKAAAEEMKERFLKLMNNTVKQVNFGTFHAIFFTILRYAYKYNYSNIIKNDVKQKFIREIVAKYDQAFSQIPELFVQKEIPESDTTRHLYILRIRPEKLTIDRKQFFEAMAAENICCNVHYIPVYYHPYYEKLGYEKGLCPNAEKLYSEIMSLPLYYSLTDQDVEDVIAAVRKLCAYYKKKG